MGQVNIYVPDELEEKIRREAKREGKSVSAFVLEAVKHRVEPEQWSSDFVQMLQASEGDIPDIEDLPIQTSSDLDDES